MTLVVEDGTGITNANSYASVAVCIAYADAMGADFDTANEVEPTLRRATQFVDSYRSRFSGVRTFRRAQGLEWPRQGAYYNPHKSGINGYQQSGYYPQQQYYPDWDYIAPNQIPSEIINATCEAAIREMATPGVLMPDLERGGALKMIRAGDSAFQYAGNASPRTTFTAIENILSDLIVRGSFGIAVRS